jgi:hypothetical protein
MELSAFLFNKKAVPILYSYVQIAPARKTRKYQSTVKEPFNSLPKIRVVTGKLANSNMPSENMKHFFNWPFAMTITKVLDWWKLLSAYVPRNGGILGSGSQFDSFLWFKFPRCSIRRAKSEMVSVQLKL